MIDQFIHNWPVHLFVFVFGYTICAISISIFYHRALAHGGLTMSPKLKRFVVTYGSWLTGIDPKAWACMHRMHHLSSDTKDDPHSPHNSSYFGVLFSQLHSYQRTLVRLKGNRENYTAVVQDLDFPVSWLNRTGLWFLPYLCHLVVGVCLGYIFSDALLPFTYAISILGHPIYGWVINSFSHGYGYRNYETPDRSTNNPFTGILTFGEGYQNNHHHDASSVNFAVKRFEFDLGYWICRAMERFKLLEINRPLPSS